MENGELNRLGYRALEPDTPFAFECVKHCWGTCCRNVHVRLDPYDVVDLARGLGVGTGEVLARHVTLTAGARGWPIAMLTEASEGPCAFLQPDGRCGVYAHRPTVCRTAPVGRALERDGGERLFFAKPHPDCAGCFAGAPVQTARQWQAASGLDARYPHAEAYQRLADRVEQELGFGEWATPQIVNLVVTYVFDIDAWQGELSLALPDPEALARGRSAAWALLLPVAGAFGRGPQAGCDLDPAIAAGYAGALACLRGEGHEPSSSVQPSLMEP
jgi:Fe-S-cluster containining protein